MQCFNNKILVVGREGRVARRQAERGGFCHLQNVIGRIEAVKEGIDVMVAILTSAKDFQPEIDLIWR